MKPIRYPGVPQTLSDAERGMLYARIGSAYIGVQKYYQERYPPADIIPELIAALLSLAVFLGRNAAGIPRDGMKEALEAALTEEYDSGGGWQRQ